MNSDKPIRPNEDDMISRPRLCARAASLETLAAENERLREDLAEAKDALADLIRFTAGNC